MKFLVLSLFVCAASAASFYTPASPAYKPYRANSYASVTVQGPVVDPVVPVVPVAPVVEAVRRVAVPAVTATKTAVKTVSDNVDAVVLKSDSEVNPDGYNFAYETSNGIAASESGAVKTVGNENAWAVKGQFQYVNPEGDLVQVSYVADENGFQPSSDFLPQGPPVPKEILRSLEYIAAHPPSDDKYAKKF